MWIALALLSAAGSAATAFSLKRAMSWGGPIASTILLRASAGVILLTAVLILGPAPVDSPAYLRAVAIALPFELIGTLGWAMALRSGELSLVQPLFGLLPVVVTLSGAVVFGERPTPAALAGVALVAAGIYTLGVNRARGPLAPFKALASHPAGRWAGLSVLAWSVTSVVHKLGIAAVGPMSWGVTLAFGSAFGFLLLIPFLPESLRVVAIQVPGARRHWSRWAALGGGLFALQQVGLQFALREAPVSYVIPLTSTSLVFAVLVGAAFLGERAALRQRLGAATLVATGAALVALYG